MPCQLAVRVEAALTHEIICSRVICREDDYDGGACEILHMYVSVQGEVEQRGHNIRSSSRQNTKITQRLC